MKELDQLGQRLRWARTEQGITLQQLSDRCGRAVSYLCQLEKGNKDNPTKQTVEALAGALGVRPAFLFGEVPSPAQGHWPEADVAHRAAGLGKAFRRYWEGRPGYVRTGLECATVEERFAFISRFLVEQDPQNFTPIELAWQLGMSVRQFEAIMQGQSEVSHHYMDQLIRLSGVPITFLTYGTLDPVEVNAEELRGDALRYVEAIKLALERKVSPEKLEALIRALAD